MTYAHDGVTPLDAAWREIKKNKKKSVTTITNVFPRRVTRIKYRTAEQTGLPVDATV